MRVATLAYVEHRAEVAAILRNARAASRAGHLMLVIQDAKRLHEGGFLTPRHVRTIFKPWRNRRPRWQVRDDMTMLRSII
jgi:hypothetical protein